MLKFAIKVTIFILPLAVLLGITEYRARLIPSNFAVKHARLEQNIDATKIIILGASHAYYGINPNSLGVPAVSIAYPGQDIYYDTRILLKYLPQAVNTKLVIINISYPSFESTMGDSPWKAQTGFYHKFWGIPPESREFRLADYSAVMLFGMERSRDFLLTGRVAETDIINENGGNANLRETSNFDVINGQTAVKRHEYSMRVEHIAQNKRYLDELLSALKEKNIEAVIVTTPCFHSYYDNINTEKYVRMQNEVHGLSQKYGLVYRNYLKDSRFTLEDFQDGDHLNTSGMEKFSRILKDEVITKYFCLP